MSSIFGNFTKKISILPVVGLNLPQEEEPLHNNIMHI
jgi:hypothetical protein